MTEARETNHAADLAAAAPPDLIVVDADGPPAGSRAGAARLAAAAARNAIPIVVVGTAKHRASPLPIEQFVAKPYHYGALIRRIEELLQHRAEDSPKGRSEGKALGY